MSTKRVGKYEIVEEIGRGGFGTVYRARDTMLDREVALKVLHPQLLVDPGFVTRFQQEARAAARLKHPHIVTIHDLGEAEGVWYIAMELLPGRPLDEIIREEGSLAPEQALIIVQDIGSALDSAHEQGLIHRDVKPSNILVGNDGHATLTDFGLVRAALLSTVSTSMGLIGTPAYMSPEQCEGEELDGRSDLYALAVVLYEMLTGRAPFQAETPLAVMRGHTDKAPPPPRELNPDLPVEVEAVVLKALAKGREERYQSGAALAATLGQTFQAKIREQAKSLVREPAAMPVQTSTAAGAPTAAETKTEAPSIAQPKVSAPQTLPKQSTTRKTGQHKSLPGWIWAMVGGVVVLVVLAIAIGAALGGGNGAETTIPQPTRTIVAVATVAPTLPANPTPIPTTVAKTNTPQPTASMTNTPQMTASMTNTPKPTVTTTPSPTSTKRPPTATDTPQPTATLAPTDTPTPKVPQAGGTKTRSKDGMTMVYVSAGPFLMGSTDVEIGVVGASCGDWCYPGQFDDEAPQHEVSLAAFWIDKTEVSNAQYQKCVAAGACRVEDMSEYDPLRRPNYPVVQVTWTDASTYCKWAGARLPTEAEWEKAARGTDGQLYPWGNSFDCTRGNFDTETHYDTYLIPGSPNCDRFLESAPCGTFPGGASPYGALDMAGNVWEWTSDWYDSDYYTYAPDQNPQNTQATQYRVMRGGSSMDGMWDVRCTYRYKDTPPTERWFNVGFRCVVPPGE